MISCDDTGLMLTVFQHDGSATKTEIKWNEVEKMDGWERLTDALPQSLPGARPVADWWDKVVQPPFAANPTTLFSR